MRICCCAFVLALGAITLAGCGGFGSPRATPTPLQNTSGFPLYPKSTVLSVDNFRQKVTSAGTNSVFASGTGTYEGRQIVAVSSASFAQLCAWLNSVDSHPPTGYKRLGFEAPQSRAQARSYGFDYATFSHGSGSAQHGFLVVVVDPQRVNEKFGTVLGLIGKYRMLPAPLRAPIDERVKSQIGVTLSQLLQPDNPIGAALSALDEFEKQNARGIVLLDAVKR